MSDIYNGRLVCDGYGNLLADEGDRAGDPVAYHEGSFVFLQPGELSHNDRHHSQFADVVGTTDETADQEGNEHHFGPTEDDPHRDGLKFGPDKIEAKITSHTDAWKGQ